MYTTNPPRAAARTLAVLAFVLCSTSFASPIVVFDFDGADGFENLPQLAADGFTVSPSSDFDGALTDFAGNPGRAIAARDWLDGNVLTFSLQMLPGFALRLDGFAFDQRASASGPLEWALAIAGTPLATGQTSLGFATHSGAFSPLTLAGLIPVELVAGGASSASGTWRVDNFVLTGQVEALSVPEPQTWLLLVAGLVMLTSYQRYRRVTG